MKFFPNLSSSELLFWAFLGLFSSVFAWAILFVVDKSVTADGEVSPRGRPVVVQSAYDGRILELAVGINDAVVSGQVVAVIDPDSDQSSLRELEAELYNLSITRLRLLAQLEKREDFLQENDSRIKKSEAFADQLLALKAALSSHRQETKVIDSEILVTRRLLESAKLKKDAEQSRLHLAEKKLELVKQLAEKGYEGELALLEGRQEADEAKRNLISADSEISQATFEIDTLLSKKSLVQLEFDQTTSSELAEISKQIDITRVRLTELQQRLSGYTLRAPSDGIVSRIAFNFSGEIVKSGETVAEIIPEDTPMVFYARVPVESVDEVFQGQKVKITLSTMSSKSSAPLEGQVELVEGDASTDEKSGQKYYLAIVGFNNITDKQKLTPGVTGTASILLGERSVAEYFLEPIFDALGNSLGES
jgi:HlyD family type I secretion membrane fusion protein